LELVYRASYFPILGVLVKTSTIMQACIDSGARFMLVAHNVKIPCRGQGSISITIRDKRGTTLSKHPTYSRSQPQHTPTVMLHTLPWRARMQLCHQQIWMLPPSSLFPQSTSRSMINTSSVHYYHMASVHDNNPTTMKIPLIPAAVAMKLPILFFVSETCHQRTHHSPKQKMLPS
jgi:hypothetical protein